MKKYGGTRYNSRWDKSTWCIVFIIIACNAWTLFFDDEIWATTISLTVLAFVITAFRSIYYKVDGDQLIVYQGFISKAYPIGQIKEVRRTSMALSAPATSLSHRLAITFTDRKILKSNIPLIISPVHQPEFIRQLLTINPNIKYEET